MSKYDTILAEYLMTEDTDWSEEVGDSSSGSGWAGLDDLFGVIVREAPDGSVTTIVCKSSADMLMKWADIEHELEPSAEEPDEEDYVISPRLMVSPLMQTYETLEMALEAIWVDMRRRQFFPNVWLQDDHGGFTNVSEDVPGRT